MKKSTLVVLTAVSVSFAVGNAVLAQQNTEAVQKEAANEELSDQLYDFQMKIDGELYAFPMTYEEFKAKGWELEENSYNPTEDETLSPSQYGMVYFEKGNEKCCIYVLNLGNDVKPIKECLAGGISIEDFSWAKEEGEVLLPGNLKRGEATIEDIEKAYGKPTRVYEGDLYTSYTYEKNMSYESVEITIDKESGALDGITLKNYVEPEGFDAGEVKEDVPEEIAQYKAPETLGESFTDYQTEFDGVVYQLPVPVATLIENGWAVDKSNSDEFISAKSSGWVGLYKGGMNFRTLARNEADYATIPENCWIEELSAGDYGMEVPMKISGGVEIGMSITDLEAALEKSGAKYEKEDSTSYAFYSVGEDTWNGAAIYTCTDKECTIHTPETVYKIELSHEK